MGVFIWLVNSPALYLLNDSSFHLNFHVLWHSNIPTILFRDSLYLTFSHSQWRGAMRCLSVPGLFNLLEWTLGSPMLLCERMNSIPFCTYTFPFGSHQLINVGFLLYPCCCAQSCGEHRNVHVSPSHWLYTLCTLASAGAGSSCDFNFWGTPTLIPIQPLWVSTSSFLRWEQQPCWLWKSASSLALNPSFLGLLVFLIILCICCQSKQP